jgi:hypothetical protein
MIFVRVKFANDFESPPRISVNLPMISETPGRCGSGSLAAQRGAFSRSH